VLIRLAERGAARFSGVGVDLSELAIGAARERAALRAPEVDLDFRVEDASSSSLPPESFDFAACVGSTHALGGVTATAARLHELVRPGGTVLIGEGYWRDDPPDAYLEALGGATRDELPGLGGLIETCEEAGLRSTWCITSSEDDWDRYEWRLISNGERWAAEHPGDPLAEPVLTWVDRARRRVLAPGGRTSLGFALVLLRRV
jgi:SAM-dependent methyltransferase